MTFKRPPKCKYCGVLMEMGKTDKRGYDYMFRCPKCRHEWYLTKDVREEYAP